MSESDLVTAETRLWIEVLDRLEADLIDTEALVGGDLQGPVPGWVGPDSMPYLPESLVDRVRELLARQASVVERLEATRLEARRQMRYLSQDPARGLAGGPRFIDQRA